MALEIHENFYQGLRSLLGNNSSKLQPSFVKTDGTKFKQTYFSSIIAANNGGFAAYSSDSNKWWMRVGNGERTSDADYNLGSTLSNIGNVSSSVSVSYDDTSKIITAVFVATGKNNNSEQISITEIGLITYCNSYTNTVLCAYEHLDTPIVVEPGAYFTAQIVIKIQT